VYPVRAISTAPECCAAVLGSVVVALALGVAAYGALLGSTRRQRQVERRERALEDAVTAGHPEVDATFRSDESRGFAA
jgi:hypothetical protein